MPEHLAQADKDDEGSNDLTPDHRHEGAFKASAVADQEDADNDPHHHPCDQAGCQQPQPPLAYQHALGHDAYTHWQGVRPEQESARDRGQVEEPFDKRRQGEQDRADPGAQEACVDEERPGSDRRDAPVGPVGYGAAQGHLQSIGRHFEQQRYPSECRKRAENSRAGRTRYEHEVQEAPEVDCEGHCGNRPATALLAVRGLLSVACHASSPGHRPLENSLTYSSARRARGGPFFGELPSVLLTGEYPLRRAIYDTPLAAAPSPVAGPLGGPGRHPPDVSIGALRCGLPDD